jgi:hypothetical protein
LRRYPILIISIASCSTRSNPPDITLGTLTPTLRQFAQERCIETTIDPSSERLIEKRETVPLQEKPGVSPRLLERLGSRTIQALHCPISGFQLEYAPDTGALYYLNIIGLTPDDVDAWLTNLEGAGFDKALAVGARERLRQFDPGEPRLDCLGRDGHAIRTGDGSRTLSICTQDNYHKEKPGWELQARVHR